jgi:hypothetical protein
MTLLKSFIAWAVLIVVLYATGEVIAADGWLTGGGFLLTLLVFFAIVSGIRDLLTLPFKNHRNG